MEIYVGTNGRGMILSRIFINSMYVIYKMVIYVGLKRHHISSFVMQFNLKQFCDYTYETEIQIMNDLRYNNQIDIWNRDIISYLFKTSTFVSIYRLIYLIISSY